LYNKFFPLPPGGVERNQRPKRRARGGKREGKGEKGEGKRKGEKSECFINNFPQ